MDGRKNNGGARRGAGRKPKSQSEELKAIMDEACDYEGRVKIVRTLASRAAAGDVQATALFLGYAFGKPLQRQEVSGAEGGALQIVLREVVNTSHAND